MRKGKGVDVFQKKELFLYNFSVGPGKIWKQRGGASDFAEIWEGGFGTLPKFSVQKTFGCHKYPKIEAYNREFGTLSKFLQVFDHFMVEIFLGLDYNGNRESEEGPCAEHRVG